MTDVNFAVFRFRSRMSHEALRLALLFAPSEYTRLWLDRGLELAGEGMRREIRTGSPVQGIDVEFPPHGFEIPRQEA